MKHIVYVRATGIYDDSRATKEITALAKAGYRVTVLGWSRDTQALTESEKVFSAVRGAVSFRFFEKAVAGGIGLKNIDKLVGFFRWVATSLRQCGHIDAVHACNLDAGLGVYRYCNKHHIPLVYDIYDYYIDSHAIPKMLVSAVERAEIRLINSAAVTIICTEERREQLAKAKPKQVIVLHNSPDVEALIPDSVIYDYAYCGALGPKRLLEEVVTAYPKNNDLSVCFAGSGRYQPQVAALSEEQERVTFLGALPYGKVIETELKARVLSAIYEPTIRNHRLCAPNKFYEALALSKPLIVCRGTGIDRIVEEHDIGLVIAYDAAEFFSAVRTLVSQPERCAEMGARARQLYEKQYCWSIMESRLLDAYAQIL